MCGLSLKMVIYVVCHCTPRTRQLFAKAKLEFVEHTRKANTASGSYKIHCFSNKIIYLVKALIYSLKAFLSIFHLYLNFLQTSPEHLPFAFHLCFWKRYGIKVS